MTVTPPLLKEGDSVALIAPSRVIQKEQVATAYKVFEEWGLNVIEGKALFHKDGYFAGTDKERLNDLQSFLDDKSIKAIFCARGGYGMTRIVDQVNFSELVKHPKWVVGFSDITALHLSLSQFGIESIHGLMPVQYGKSNTQLSLRSLHSLLFEGSGIIEATQHKLNRYGQSQGQIIGGNLSLVAESLGTPTEVTTNGCILFLEEIDEYLYKIDRMLNQLKRAGKFKNLKGLIIGDFSDMKDTQIKFGNSIYELIMGHVKDYSFPVAFNFPIGHEMLNLAVPVSRKATFNVSEKGSSLSF